MERKSPSPSNGRTVLPGIRASASTSSRSRPAVPSGMTVRSRSIGGVCGSSSPNSAVWAGAYEVAVSRFNPSLVNLPR